VNSREATIALNMLPKIGPVRVRRMVEMFGDPVKILRAKREDLLKVDGLGSKTVDVLLDWESQIDLSAEIASAKDRGIEIYTAEDEAYPRSLREMYDPPLALYVWGELKSADSHGIAMVGTRHFTHYGRQVARQLAFQLAQTGVTVISGLARGIDTFSHEGAIAAGGRTVAVIGSGLANIYPPENMSLAEKIAAGNGAVVSEFPLSKVPDKQTFPMRNRIVAGWSSGVLVVECPKWSGSLITANLANDMGKPIYAVPGPIDSPQSAGCNALIRNGATLVTSADDILEDREVLPLFQVKNQVQSSDLNPALLTLSDVERAIFEAIGKQPKIIDELVEETQMPLPQLNVTLLQMEIKKVIQQLPGQRYVQT
jgi:DNA processing protein